MIADAVRQVLQDYPRIFFACHVSHVRDTTARRTISARQASILDHLDDVEPISLTQLAQHMGVTLSTMSLAADRLERQGYLVRTRDTADARRVGLRLTRAGARIKDQDKVLDPERLRALLSRLSAAERKAALRGRALLARAASEEMHARHAAASGWRRGKSAPEEPAARSRS